MAHAKQREGIGITDTTGILGYKSIFVGIFYRNMLQRNYNIVMVAKWDTTARIWLALTWRFAEKLLAGGLHRWTTEQEEAVTAMGNMPTFQLRLWDKGWWKELVAESCSCGIPVGRCLAEAFSAQLHLLPFAS